MSKGSSRCGRKQKARTRRTPDALASSSLSGQAEALGRIADRIAVISIWLDDPEVEAILNKALACLWTAERRVKCAVDMLALSAVDALQPQAAGGES